MSLPIIILIACVAVAALVVLLRQVRPSVSSSVAAIAQVPYKLGDTLDDGEYFGHVEFVSWNGRFGAGYLVSSEPVNDDQDFKTNLVVVDLLSREWLVQVRGPKVWYDETYPLVAAVSGEGTAATLHDEGERLILVDVNEQRLWSRKLPLDGEPDQVAFSPDGSRILVEWLGVGIVVFDVESGKRSLTRKWNEEEKYLDVEFSNDGSLYGVHRPTGPGSAKNAYPLDSKGRPPPEYLAAVDLALKDEQSRDPRWVLPKVKEMLAGTEPDLDVISDLLGVLSNGASALSKRQHARVFRYHGEVAASRGESDKAIEWWSKALDLDPKVGIRGRFERLQRRRT